MVQVNDSPYRSAALRFESLMILCVFAQKPAAGRAGVNATPVTASPRGANGLRRHGRYIKFTPAGPWPDMAAGHPTRSYRPRSRQGSDQADAPFASTCSNRGIMWNRPVLQRQHIGWNAEPFRRQTAILKCACMNWRAFHQRFIQQRNAKTDPILAK